VNYAELLEIDSFFSSHIILEVGKDYDLGNEKCQTVGDALTLQYAPANISIIT
jgi:hypothetical protein